MFSKIKSRSLYQYKLRVIFMFIPFELSLYKKMNLNILKSLSARKKASFLDQRLAKILLRNRQWCPYFPEQGICQLIPGGGVSAKRSLCNPPSLSFTEDQDRKISVTSKQSEEEPDCYYFRPSHDWGSFLHEFIGTKSIVCIQPCFISNINSHKKKSDFS